MSTTALSLLLAYAKNAALLTVGVWVYAHARPRLARYPAWLQQLLAGLCFSLLVAIALANPIELQGGVRIDLRATLVALAVVFGGPLCGLVATIAGIALRVAVGGPNVFGGVLIVVAPYLLSLVYWKWVERRGRPIGYPDLLAIGIGIALYRVVIWLALFGYAFTIAAVDAAWLGTLLLLAFSTALLGAAVLLVDERRALVESVADSEARFRSVLDQLPEALTLVDTQDRFTYVNKTWQSLTGLSSAAAVGKTRHEVWEKLESSPALVGLIGRVIESGQPLRTEPQSFTVRGMPRSTVATLFPVWNARGEIREIGTTGNDVTQLVLAREDLSRREALALAYNNALLKAVHASRLLDRPMHEALRALTEIAGETLKVDRTTVLGTDFDGRHVERLDLWDRLRQEHRDETYTGRRMIAYAALDMYADGVLAVEDVAADPRLAIGMDYYREQSIRAMMGATIFAGGRLFGIVGFSMITGTRRWTPEEVNFARSIADLIALILVTNSHREALAALDLIDDGIYIEAEDGRVIFANRAARQMAGQAGEDEAQPPLFGALPIGFPRPPLPLAAEQDQHEVTLDLGTGHRDLRIQRSRLPRGGIVVLVHDITNWLAAQRERERLEQQLMQAHKLEAIGEMAGGIAHDFNNLLGAIGGFARFLDEDLPKGTDQHQYAERILAACERGKSVVTQILSFAKVRNIERQPIDLRAVLEQSREVLRGLAGPKTTMTFEIEDGVMPILGNDGQVIQLLVNLCVNANEALDGELGMIIVRARRIAYSAAAIDREERQLSLFGEPYQRRRLYGQLDANRDYVRIDVSDTGKGIPARHLTRILEPFFTTKHRQGGTGLGLAVVQSVVSLYDGVLYVDSGEGKGTTFSIYLPLTDLALEAQAQAAPEKRRMAGTERVLIVDDDVDVADMLSIGLERLGYEVAAVHDPLEALEAFCEDPAHWDVAILDRVMPEMDGITLAARLRAVRAGLPVILCTGLDDGTIARDGERRCFDAFFTKPVEPDQIAGAIRRLVDH
jgi:PAS domain S-box-containing protein